MKKNIGALLLSLLFVHNSFAFGGRNSVWRKPLGTRGPRIPRPRPPVIRIPPPQEIVRGTLTAAADTISNVGREATTVVDNVVTEVLTVPNNIATETGRAGHDVARTLGDGVKGLRNAIAQMQGVNVERNLREIRAQITSCRNDTSRLANATSKLQSLNLKVTSIKTEQPNITNQELQEKIQQELRSLEHLNNGLNVVLTVTSPAVGIGLSAAVLGGTSVLPAWAVQGGIYTAIAAAVVMVMSSSAIEEIKHESNKLAECGEDFRITANQYKSTYQEYLRLSTIDNTQQLNEHNQLVARYNDISIEYIRLVNIEVQIQSVLTSDYILSLDGLTRDLINFKNQNLNNNSNEYNVDDMITALTSMRG